MSFPRTLVHRARPPLLRPLLHKPQRLSLPLLPLLSTTDNQSHRPVTTKPPIRPQTPTKNSQPTPKKPQALPPTIPLFTIPLLPFTTLYFTRLLSLLLLGTGTLFTPPYILLSPTAPTYLIPAFALASAVPAALSAWMVGGFVTHINLHLPPEARRGQDALRRWMERGGVGGDARLSVRCMWFRPWLHRFEVGVGELRRLRGAGWREGWLRLANVEVVKREDEGEEGGEQGLLARLRRRLFVMKREGRRKGKLDEGVWERVWDAIPMVGEGEGTMGRKANVEQHISTPASSRTASKLPRKARP